MTFRGGSMDTFWNHTFLTIIIDIWVYLKSSEIKKSISDVAAVCYNYCAHYHLSCVNAGGQGLLNKVLYGEAPTLNY